MYKVLSKDIIENEILPHLSTAKRGYETKSCLTEVINSILYKLKTGIQWHMLPVSSLYSAVVLSYKTVYWHFRKWCKKGEWESSWLNILENNKSKWLLDTSCMAELYARIAIISNLKYLLSYFYIIGEKIVYLFYNK